LQLFADKEVQQNTMPIYFIRHGQSEFNAAYTRGEPDPMIFDPRLTAQGRQQAEGSPVWVSSTLFPRL